MKHVRFMRYFMSLALPVILQQLLAHLLAVSGTTMLGALSEQTISAVSVVNKYSFIYNLVIFGLTNELGLFISQYHGAIQEEDENRTSRFGLRLCIYTTCGFMFILLVSPSAVMSVFVKNQNLISLGSTYNRIVLFSFIPYTVAQVLGVGYRVIAHTCIPMCTGTLSFVLNVVLNYRLIFGRLGLPAMEIAGAAWATLLARPTEAVSLTLVSMHKESKFYFSQRYSDFDVRHKLVILKKTTPLVCNEFIWSLGPSLIFISYCFVSEQYIPALTVVDNISSMIYAAFSDCGTVTGVIIGNNLGADKLNQVVKDAKQMIKIGLVTCVINCILILLTSPITPRLFSLKGEGLQIAIWLLTIKSYITWTQGYSETVYHILRAGGDTRSVSYADGLLTCFRPLLLSTIFTRLFPLPILFLFTVVEGCSIFKIIIATWFCRKETWLKSLTGERSDYNGYTKYS